MASELGVEYFRSLGQEALLEHCVQTLRSRAGPWWDKPIPRCLPSARFDHIFLPAMNALAVADVDSPTVSEVSSLLKRWGWRHAGNGRNHREFKHIASGKSITLPAKANARVNSFTISEISNHLHLSPIEFFQGPKEDTEPKLQSVPDLQVSESTADESTTQEPDGGDAPGGPIQPDPDAPTEVVGRRLIGQRRKLVEILHAEGGSIRHEGGRLGMMLAPRMECSPGALSQLLAHCENEVLVVKDKTHPRTKEQSLRQLFGLSLVYDHPDVAATIRLLEPHPKPEPEIQPESEPEPVPSQPDWSDLISEPEPVAALDYKRLADEVVEALLRRLAAPVIEATLRQEMGDLRDKLHRSTEYAARLRKELGEERTARERAEGRRRSG